MKRAVFLDRDGVIVEDSGYIDDCSRVRILPNAGEAVKLLNESGFEVIVVTNQSGVARGYFTEETVKEINNHIRESLADQGAFIDGMYYCPHHVDGTLMEYKKDCNCRKPNPGMIEQAVHDHNIDLSNSFLIGDKASDIEAGHRAGCKTILLDSHRTTRKYEEVISKSNPVAGNLYEAVEQIINLSTSPVKEA